MNYFFPRFEAILFLIEVRRVPGLDLAPVLALLDLVILVLLAVAVVALALLASVRRIASRTAASS